MKLVKAVTERDWGWRGGERERERERNLAHKIVRTVKFKPRDQKWKFSIQTHPDPHMHTT